MHISPHIWRWTDLERFQRNPAVWRGGFWEGCSGLTLGGVLAEFEWCLDLCTCLYDEFVEEIRCFCWCRFHNISMEREREREGERDVLPRKK